ncbi:MAG: hypothetical protein QOH60_1434 [Mycobacterium sp.]|jgi:hypothetical protein|nr:hypothetical protein [Mycobacterium sp.]
MLARTWSTVRRLQVTLGYAATLLTIGTTLLLMGPRVQDHVIRHMSTNLHNLAHGRLGTLIGSAFVTSSGPMWFWLPGLVCLLALAELFWRSGRVLITFAIGHVGATLIVAMGLVAAVDFGWLPVSVVRATDVGISYGAAAVLGALTAAIPTRWRPAWIGWWAAIGALIVCTSIVGLSPDSGFTDAGHVVALALGMAVSLRFGGPARWTKVRVALFVIGVGFGYLVLVNTGLPVVIAPIVGTVGALTARRLAEGVRAGRVEPVPVSAAPDAVPV